MKKRTLVLLAVLMAVTFLFLVLLESIFFSSLADLRRKHFEDGVRRTLYQTSRILEEEETTLYLHDTMRKLMDEDETFACGTGIVASAIASFCHCYEGHKAESPVKYEVHAKRDVLTVDFMPSLSGNGENCRFTGVWLSGPAVYVAKIMV